MITGAPTQLFRVALGITTKPLILIPARQFSMTKEKQAKNRIYTPVRREDEFQSYLSLSTSSRAPLLTFWTASYCNTCKTVSHILQELVKSGVGEEEGGVSYCEIEYDSLDIMDSGLGMTYMITSMPTLLSFDRGEAQVNTKIVDPKQMRDVEGLKEWIRNEAKRGGSGGGGGGGGGFGGGGLFGGLFGTGERK